MGAGGEIACTPRTEDAGEYAQVDLHYGLDPDPDLEDTPLIPTPTHDDPYTPPPIPYAPLDVSPSVYTDAHGFDADVQVDSESDSEFDDALPLPVTTPTASPRSLPGAMPTTGAALATMSMSMSLSPLDVWRQQKAAGRGALGALAFLVVWFCMLYW